MFEIDKIHWHDCVIDSVVELPTKDQLIFNVQYPVDWDNNKYESRSIVFGDYYSQKVEEIPFSGALVILNAEAIDRVTSPLGFSGYFRVKIETNAGDRFVTAKSVILRDCHIGI